MKLVIDCYSFGQAVSLAGALERNGVTDSARAYPVGLPAPLPGRGEVVVYLRREEDQDRVLVFSTNHLGYMPNPT